MIVLSIPFLNKEFITKQVTEYRDEFEWLELRLDFHPNFNDFPRHLIDSKTIITIRDVTEGGKYSTSFSEKISFYQEIISNYNCLVDSEIEHYKKQLIPSSNLILSYHDFSEKIDYGKLESLIKTSNSISSKFLKIVVNIHNYSDFTKIKLLISDSNKPVLFAGMGKLGKISRMIYPILDSSGTYVGLSEFPTAKGQLTVIESDKINLKDINQNTKIGGIIGGIQVEKSMGLEFYNRYFRKKSLDAVYLPFVVRDFNDFWNWFESFKKRYEFFGFTITMPFKTKIAAKLRSCLPTVNLYLPAKNETFNTDAFAFIKSYQYLKMKSDDKILIFGSGSTTETALFSLNKFKNITISGRNIEICKLLAAKYKKEFKPLKEIANISFDVIINCTPLGMNNEDFFSSTNLHFPRKIIDLPYTDGKTFLIQQSVQRRIPFVDGKKFWKWQAKKQLEKFADVLNKNKS